MLYYSFSGAWKREIYFDPRVEESKGNKYNITVNALQQKIYDLLDGEDMIEQISIYSHRLFKKQRHHGILYHAFIVIESNEWFWSIEKNTKGITIQRSKQIKFVRDYYRRNKRKELVMRKGGEGNAKMKNLVQWLYDKHELNKTYNLAYSNCQVFAKRIFRKFAQNVREYADIKNAFGYRNKFSSKWNNEIYFDPQADLINGNIYYLSIEGLKENFSNLIDARIDEISIFSNKLFNRQRRQSNIHHYFVVIESNNWLWSVEKSKDGVTIQRSKQIRYVRDKFRGFERKQFLCRKQGEGKSELRNLVQWLSDENELNRPFNLLTCNSKDFSKRIFNEFVTNVIEYA